MPWMCCEKCSYRNVGNSFALLLPILRDVVYPHIMKTHEQELAIVVARFRFRAAEVAGHSAGCAVAWRHGHCSCPGRLAIHGTVKTNRLIEVEAAAYRHLISTDPDWIAWKNS